jgi:pectate lyase
MVHDGELDITNGSDLVTVSWNVFKEHSKTSLNGSSDTASGDNGKIRSTFHHNYFYNVEERVPRDRFGKIDVYDNFYDISNFGNVYSWE